MVMQTFRHTTLSLLFALPLIGIPLLIEATGQSMFAQQSPPVEATAKRDHGIQLYEQGNLKGAIEALRAAVKENPNDVIAWNSLALALERKGNRKEMRKALKRVIDLRTRLFQQEFDAAGENMTAANISRLELLHKETSDSVGKYLGVSAVSSNLREWVDTLNRLIVQGKFLELAREGLAQGKAIRWSEVPKQRARVLSKAEPIYTEEARRHHVSGTVMLSAVFEADGTIKDIRIVQGLGDGLTEAAIQSARRIKFQPATVGGQPVPQYVVIEYNFNVY